MLALVLAIALAADGGVPDAPVRFYHDAPVINGKEMEPGYFFPVPQYEKVNVEVKRLQKVEQEHINEPPPNLWPLVIGLVLGVAVGAGVAIAVKSN